MSITETISAIPTHLSIQREEFLRIIEQEDFPCVFARKAASTHKLFWLFLDFKENSQGFIEGLIDYTNFIQITPVNERLLQALVVVIETNKHHLFEQQQFAWSLIQTLIDNDPAPWPLNISQDTEHHNWCLCFNQVQLFINISCPAHDILRSRNLGSKLVLVINPREVFDVVAPKNKLKGLKIRQKIRARIKKYNSDAPIPTQLGFFGDPNNKEWQQYQLIEPGCLVLNACPLHMKKEQK